MKETAYLVDHNYDYAAYEGNRLNGGRIVQPVVAGWKIVDVPDTAPRIGVYIPLGESVDDASEYVVVLRGTDNFGDVVNDIQEAQGLKSEDMEGVLAFAKQIVEKHKGKKITFVGHSKGGGEAIAAASLTDSYAITFNAANFKFEAYGVEAPRDKYKIQNYYVEGEALYNTIGFARYGTTMPLLPTQFFLGEFVSPSWEVSYNKPNPLKNHQLIAIKRALGI